MAKSMQIKSNQDVREYKEVVYFGMTLRQLIFSGLAGASALGVYLLSCAGTGCLLNRSSGCSSAPGWCWAGPCFSGRRIR